MTSFSPLSALDSPFLGPAESPIAIVLDYPSSPTHLFPTFGTTGSFRKLLSSLDLDPASCSIFPFLPVAPPVNPKKRIPDFGMLVRERKTCPGPGWEYVNQAWVEPRVVEARRGLLEMLGRVRPRVVIALGPAALWALTGQTSLLAWRGSRLSPPDLPFTILPTHHPRATIPQPALWHDIRVDLSRARNILSGQQLPRNYSFRTAPTHSTALETLQSFLSASTHHPIKLAGDLETRAGHIACFGIADSANSAICLPFLQASETSPFYWSLEEETSLIHLCLQLFRSPNVLWVGQNFSYDCQYFHRHWGAYPLKVRDTMIAHHSLYSNTRKSLDYLSSLYCRDHIFWKDDIKDWDPKIGETQYWLYNCTDAARTYEIDDAILAVLAETV